MSQIKIKWIKDYEVISILIMWSRYSIVLFLTQNLRNFTNCKVKSDI